MEGAPSELPIQTGALGDARFLPKHTKFCWEVCRTRLSLEIRIKTTWIFIMWLMCVFCWDIFDVFFPQKCVFFNAFLHLTEERDDTLAPGFVMSAFI